MMIRSVFNILSSSKWIHILSSSKWSDKDGIGDELEDDIGDELQDDDINGEEDDVGEEEFDKFKWVGYCCLRLLI